MNLVVNRKLKELNDLTAVIRGVQDELKFCTFDSSDTVFNAQCMRELQKKVSATIKRLEQLEEDLKFELE